MAAASSAAARLLRRRRGASASSLLITALAAAAVPAAAAGAAASSSASLPPPPATAPLLGLWEVALLAPFNATPFDAASLGTWLEVTPPGGAPAVEVVPFFTAAFVRSMNATSGAEILTPSGAAAPGFAARFAPRALGTHTFVQRFLATPPPPWLEPVRGSFECVAAGAVAGDGFAHVDVRRGTFFTLDDKEAFWLVGENMAWAGTWPYFNGSSAFSNGTGGTYAYDRWLPRLAAAGGNFIRLWLGPSLARQPTWDGELGTMLAMALMGSDDGSAVFGEYNLRAAWRVDYVVELCRRLGVKIALVLDAQQAFCKLPGTWCFWDESVYNVANNGPLADPAEYYTNSATLLELRQRWAYVVSRWGYATSIFTWELANENDDWPAWGPECIAQQAALASWLPTIDPNKHMVDNSFSGSRTIVGFEDQPQVAFTSVHEYDWPDTAQLVWKSATPKVAQLTKPSFVEEFGASWTGPLQHLLDPTGIGMHTGAWASLCGLAAGSAMQWWCACSRSQARARRAHAQNAIFSGLPWRRLLPPPLPARLITRLAGNEVDSLNTYGALSGAATLSRALAPQLLALNWSTWSESAVSGLDGGAGWILGLDAATGSARLALFYVYGANYTWSAQNRSLPLNPVAGAAVTLKAVPLSSSSRSATAVCYDTVSGLPLGGGAPSAGCGATVDAADSSVAITFPTFIRDAAAVVTFEA